MEVTNIIQQIQDSIRNNWEHYAITDIGGDTLSFRDVAHKIAKLHIMFGKTGIKPGNKIALCGKNSANWAVVYLAALTYGAVPVPILHEFKSDIIHNIVNHSESVVLFVDNAIWKTMNAESVKFVRAVADLSDLTLLHCRWAATETAFANLNKLFGEKYPKEFTKDDVVYYQPASDEELAIINYTSGSTGMSKGVMLPYRAISSNIQYCVDNMPYMLPCDGMVSMLPMAHMYGLIVELTFPFVKGCHVHYIKRAPSPKVIMDAFAMVKPKLIITVPLVIEKIIKNKVFPIMEKPYMRLLRITPFINTKINQKVKDNLSNAFGGNLVELIVGGAAINKEVELFMKSIHFPYTVGYGMTECAPLISYAAAPEYKATSCGKCVDRMEMKIKSENPETVAGELLVRGQNVMLGYYKNQAATDAVFEDGWLNTGDLCTIDKDGFLFIRGRSKNMILGPSGQNIYPEEIEQRINNMPFVGESIVIERDQKLVALIHPDIELGAQQGFDYNMLESMMSSNIDVLNKELAAYERISKVECFREEFEKTPKRSIKRYLYM